MESDENPTMTIETDYFQVTVHDKQTAKASLPLVQEVYAEYLGKAPTVDDYDKPPRKRLEAMCNDCGYEWTFNGHYPSHATCPDCHTHVNIKKQHENEDNE